MKKVIYSLMVMLSITSVAMAQQQDSLRVATQLTIPIAEQVALNEEFSAVLVKVLSDSRCPKNVTCVWAGKAEALVHIYKKGVLYKKETISFHPNYLEEEVLSFFSLNNFKVTAVQLLPYPDGVKAPKKQSYKLVLDVLR